MVGYAFRLAELMVKENPNRTKLQLTPTQNSVTGNTVHILK